MAVSPADFPTGAERYDVAFSFVSSLDLATAKEFSFNTRLDFSPRWQRGGARHREALRRGTPGRRHRHECRAEIGIIEEAYLDNLRDGLVMAAAEARPSLELYQRVNAVDAPRGISRPRSMAPSRATRCACSPVALE